MSSPIAAVVILLLLRCVKCLLLSLTPFLRYDKHTHARTHTHILSIKRGRGHSYKDDNSTVTRGSRVNQCPTAIRVVHTGITGVADQSSQVWERRGGWMLHTKGETLKKLFVLFIERWQNEPTCVSKLAVSHSLKSIASVKEVHLRTLTHCLLTNIGILSLQV